MPPPQICDFGLARADFADVSKHTVFWTDYVATRCARAARAPRPAP